MLKYFLFCLATLVLQAEVQDHFKKIDPSSKGPCHSMKNIDFIYVINLDQRPEKFEHCKKELEPYGIHPFRFSAVNGWELSLATINDVGVRLTPGMDCNIKATSYLPENGGAATEYIEPHFLQNFGQTYFCHAMSRGAIGIVLSHLSILQDAVDSGYETIWVMEDDIKIIQNPHKLSRYIEKLDQLVGKDNWDILFTDPDTKDQQGNYVGCFSFSPRPNFKPEDPLIFRFRTNISKSFRRISARYGAYSMIVRRSGMMKILDFIKTYHIFLPYDMDNYLHPGIKIYTVREDVVSTLPKAISDNGAPYYLDKEKK